MKVEAGHETKIRGNWKMFRFPFNFSYVLILLQTSPTKGRNGNGYMKRGLLPHMIACYGCQILEVQE